MGQKILDESSPFLRTVANTHLSPSPDSVAASHGLPDARTALKHPLDDGTTHLVFKPLELLEKLAVLVPPPREHLVLYHGVLSPCASLRDQVVPPPPPASPGACAGSNQLALR